MLVLLAGWDQEFAKISCIIMINYYISHPIFKYSQTSAMSLASC